jgi:hypothetical protein
MNNTFKLGRSIPLIVPFQAKKQIVEQRDKIPFKVIILISLAIKLPFIKSHTGQHYN